MFKLIQFLLLIFNPFLLSPAFSQSMDGLKEIVTIQQEKIARIENNVKNLIGSFESLSNSKSMVKVPEDLENKINTINQKLNLLENNLKNITNLSYDLDFALKRIERLLELTSINNGTLKQGGKDIVQKPSFVDDKNNNITTKNLENKTEGVLGFIKEQSSSNLENNTEGKFITEGDTKKNKLLTKSSPEENLILH